MMNREIKQKIDNASSISILLSVNPHSTGTALGIYSLLKQIKGKRVEVVNLFHPLPHYLDFLPHYKKIKHQMDYSDSLIITCESIDRLDVKQRDRINITALSNTSSALEAYRLFENDYDMTAEVAECFYTALCGETNFFTKDWVNLEIVTLAQKLLSKGLKPDKIVYHLRQRRSLASLRIVERTLASLRLYNEARVAVVCVRKEDRVASGATMLDMEGLSEYGNSLSTVEISICAIELEEEIHISLESTQLDVLLLAATFTADRDKVVSHFTLKDTPLEESIEKVLIKIKELGMLDGI